MRAKDIMFRNFGVMKLAAEDYEEAKLSFEKVEQPDGETHYFLSQTYTKMNEPEKAFHHMKLSKEMGYVSTMSAWDLFTKRFAISKFMDEKWEVAKNSFLKIKNPDAESYYYLACAYRELNQFDEAISSLEQAEEMGYPEAHAIMEKMRRE